MELFLRSNRRKSRKIYATGRKLATQETREGCLAFLIISFSELFEVLENLHSLSKRFFDKLCGALLHFFRLHLDCAYCPDIHQQGRLYMLDNFSFTVEMPESWPLGVKSPFTKLRTTGEQAHFWTMLSETKTLETSSPSTPSAG